VVTPLYSLLHARPVITFPAEDISALWLVPNCTAWW